MIPISDFQRRSLTGPVMKEQEFDMFFAKSIRGIVKRYPIKFNTDEIIPDDALADTVFEAAIDLLAEVGLYNRDTQRVIQFNREEVVQIAKDVWEGPREVSFGKGKDEAALIYRTHDDPRPPTIWMGSAGMPSTEELYIPYMQSFIQEELCQGCCGPAMLASYQGVENKAGTPGEVFCNLAEIKLTQEAARRAGKPDTYIGQTSATSAGGLMAICFPGMLERYNTTIALHMMPEQKLDWSRLVLALSCEERGLIPWTSAISLIGALCRGPEDSAVTLVANLLGQFGYAHGRQATLGAATLAGSISTLEALWAYSAAARASERHLGFPVGGAGQSQAGAGTEMAFFEKAAQTVVEVASGAGWLWYSGCRLGRGNNPTTGLEARLIAETGHAVAGMKSADANDLIIKIYAKYADQLSAAPEGKNFGDLYDVQKVQPISEYLDVYKHAKDELARLGVPFK
jgi:methylamine--corrinoid protein Co-methyltransferase